MEASLPLPYAASQTNMSRLSIRYTSDILRSRSLSPKPSEVVIELREITRTPSPTPSENEALQSKFMDPRRLLTKEFWWSKQMLLRLIALGFVVCVVLMLTEFRRQIASALSPAAEWMHRTHGGWLIPIAIMIALSFPPLLGHELVALMCGFVWGLGRGFGIVAAGIFFGEVISFYVFRHFCMPRGHKLERTSIKYACLAHVVRQGDFKIVLIMRFSAIPSHFTTAIFSTCGVRIVPFCLAAILSLPKQLIAVYLGTTLGSLGDEESHTDKIVSHIVLVVGIASTMVGGLYMYKRAAAVLPEVVYARRKARQGMPITRFPDDDLTEAVNNVV